jgi:hypothetical protein
MTGSKKTLSHLEPVVTEIYRTGHDRHGRPERGRCGHPSRAASTFMNLASSKDATFGGNSLDVVRGRADGRPRSLRSSSTDITVLGPGGFLDSPRGAPQLSSLDCSFRGE